MKQVRETALGKNLIRAFSFPRSERSLVRRAFPCDPSGPFSKNPHVAIRVMSNSTRFAHFFVRNGNSV